MSSLRRVRCEPLRDGGIGCDTLCVGESILRLPFFACAAIDPVGNLDAMVIATVQSLQLDTNFDVLLVQYAHKIRRGSFASDARVMGERFFISPGPASAPASFIGPRAALLQILRPFRSSELFLK